MAKECISVVIPVYNEERNILPLCQSLKKALDSLNRDYEVIFVDDGSADSSFSVLSGIASKDSSFKVIKFRKNFGQTAALNAGIKFAKYPVIVTMDADLQNDPADIPRLLEKMEEGYDIVSGWRFMRHDPLSKKLFSLIARWLRKLITKDTIHDAGCSLKAYRKECFDNIELYGEMHRFITTILSWKGYKIAEIKVRHHPRAYGRTKYGFSRIMRGFFDLLNAKFWSSYSKRPIHFFAKLGVFSFIMGILIIIYNIVRYGLHLGIGPSLLFSLLFFVMGVQFIAIGFISEFQARIYYSQNQKELYSIEKTINLK